MALINKLTAIADEVRELSGTSETLTLDDMASSIGEVNSEIGTQSDLLDQVVVALEDKASGGGNTSFPIGDGNTHLWITLQEGRTSLLLGLQGYDPATVDWGDGTDRDVVTLDSNLKQVQHDYSKAGDYVITLSDCPTLRISGGSYGSYLLMANSELSSKLNWHFRTALKKAEIGSGFNSFLADGSQSFANCYGLTSVVSQGAGTSIGRKQFMGCAGLCYVDFTKHTTVPALTNIDAFSDTPSDLEIRVPAALYDEWIAATNWSTYASKIVAV